MKKARKQVQSALAINRCRRIDGATDAAAPCIADLAFTHAFDPTVAVAAAFGGGRRGKLGLGGAGARGERNEPDTEVEHSNLQTVLTMMATETSPPMALLGCASCLRRDTKLLASLTRMLEGKQ